MVSKWGLGAKKLAWAALFPSQPKKGTPNKRTNTQFTGHHQGPRRGQRKEQVTLVVLIWRQGPFIMNLAMAPLITLESLEILLLCW